MEGAFIVWTVSVFQGSIVLMKNECLHACSRERWTLSCKGCPLRPAAICSVAQWVRAGCVNLLRGMSTKLCWILYSIVSLAVCLRCSKVCHFNWFIISVGLLWRRQSNHSDRTHEFWSLLHPCAFTSGKLEKRRNFQVYEMVFTTCLWWLEDTISFPRRIPMRPLSDDWKNTPVSLHRPTIYYLPPCLGFAWIGRCDEDAFKKYVPC